MDDDFDPFDSDPNDCFDPYDIDEYYGQLACGYDDNYIIEACEDFEYDIDYDGIDYDSYGESSTRRRCNTPTQMASGDSMGSGTIVKLVPEKNFGFIKSVQDLPSDFNNKDVFFGGIPTECNLQVGDVITFKLSPWNKERPSAESVEKNGLTIINNKKRGRVCSQFVVPEISNSIVSENNDSKFTSTNTKPSLSAILSKASISRVREKGGKNNEKPNFKVRQHGQIVKLDDKYGFIKPIGALPQGYENRDVYFMPSKVKSGGLNLKLWDEVEFILGTKDKTKPMALNVKLTKFRKRSAEDLKDFLEKLAEKLAAPMSKSERKNPEYVDTILSVLTCEALWEAIGSCKELSNASTLKVIEIMQLLDKHGIIFKENFRKIMQTLCETAFLNIRSGKIREILKCEINSCGKVSLIKLQKFLIQVVKYVPGKLTAVTALAKLMLPDDESNVAHFFFEILNETAKFSSDYMEDMEWNELPLVPSVLELQSGLQNQRLDLMPVKPEGSYDSADAYVDTYFRLMRADCFSKLCEGVHSLLNGNLDPRDMNVYHSIQFAGIHITDKETGLNLALKLTPLKDVEDWATSSNLMFGNLLCISISGTFSDPIWASVANRDEDLLQKENIIVIELAGEVNSLNDADVVSLLMKNLETTIIAESPTYYRAYKPTLKALQALNIEQMPFKEELVGGKTAENITPEFLDLDSEIDVSSVASNYNSSCYNSPIE